MQKRLIRGLAIGVAAVFVFAFVPVTVFAVEEAETTETTSTTVKDRITSEKDERQENRQKRLTQAKLKLCEARKKRIAVIMTRGVERAENQLAVFTKISDRVQAFYVKKGKTLANYDELVAAANAAKAKAEADIATLKTLGSFACDSEDPKGDAEAFKEALETVRKDLKDYRTAVKNLIVGVKSAQSTTVKQEEEQQ